MELRLGAEVTAGPVFTQQLSPESGLYVENLTLPGLCQQQVVPWVGIAFDGFKPPLLLAEIFLPQISWMRGES